MCECFGYLNCTECFNDCIVNCNWIRLCCNCTRCLAGTCQCCKAIGLLKCLKKVGCDEKKARNLCKKDSSLCVMFFFGLIELVAAAAAAVIVFGQLKEYMARATEASDLGDAYVCDFDGEDIASNMKFALTVNMYVYIMLAFGCILSCASSLAVVMRWLALPFHWICGLFGHLAAIAATFVVASSEGGVYCSEDASNETVKEHATFLITQKGSQWWLAAIFTFLVLYIGCKQKRLRDNVKMKRDHRRREKFLKDKKAAAEKIKAEKKKKYDNKLALEQE